MAKSSNTGTAVIIIVLGGAGLLIYSGLTGVNLSDALMGKGNPLDPSGGKQKVSPASGPGTNVEGDPSSSGTSSGPHTVPAGASPKQIIDDVVLPIARRNGINRTTAQNTAANAAHSVLTTSGNPSDHKGPPNKAWAADMSNGSSPTPEMDKLAKDLAAQFGIPWNGSGLVNHTAGGYRYQLIWRAEGHYDHVHLGIKKV